MPVYTMVIDAIDLLQLYIIGFILSLALFTSTYDLSSTALSDL